MSTFQTEFIDVQQYKVLISKVPDSCSKASIALAFEHTEYWWISGQITFKYFRDGDYVNKIQIIMDNNGYSDKYINKYNDKVLSAAKTIADNAKKQNTVYKRIKYIHDYLISYIDYGKGKDDFSPHSTYGALINKLCTCGGYAKTFVYIARLVGIEAIVINGNTVNGSHFWNYVKIDNIWYLIDLTFDDPGKDEQTPRYTFFLIGWGDQNYKDHYKESIALAMGLKYPTLSETNYKRPNLV